MMRKSAWLLRALLTATLSLSLNTAVQALTFREAQTRATENNTRYTFTTEHYDFYLNQPWRSEPDAVVLGRNEAFSYLYNQYGGIGDEGHVFGSSRTKGVEFKVHHTGPMRGVTVMYKQVVW
jgi:hypothetical protein